LLRFVAEQLALPKAAVTLKSGQTSRRKVLAVCGSSPAAVGRLLAP
jgi:uncharacterized protein YggU (UPF0235/DUF167 family)